MIDVTEPDFYAACSYFYHIWLAYFVFLGKVGDWKNHLTSEMSQKIDDYVEKHFKDSGLTFEYEI